MNTADLLSEIRRLPHEERVRLANELWAELDGDAGPLLTEAQREFLRQRLEEDRRNPDDVLPWSGVLKSARHLL